MWEIGWGSQGPDSDVSEGRRSQGYPSSHPTSMSHLRIFRERVEENSPFVPTRSAVTNNSAETRSHTRKRTHPPPPPRVTDVPRDTHGSYALMSTHRAPPCSVRPVLRGAKS